MKKITKVIIATVTTLLLINSVAVKNGVFSDELNNQQDRLNKITEERAKVEQQIAEAQKQERTLSEQISYMNNQIRLTQLQIEETEDKLEILAKDIEVLIQKIGRLESSLDQIAEILLNRVKETYINGKIKPFELMLSSGGFSDLLSRWKYIRAAQAHDKRLMYQIQATKANYEDQKKLLEEKKREQEELKKRLEGYKITLASQKKDKEHLLEVTRNDERRFQKILAELKAEQEAIERAISDFIAKLIKEGVPPGKEIKKGETIGVQGSTGLSTGPHVHFGVYNKCGDSWCHTNPRSYIDNGSLSWPLDDFDVSQEYGPANWTPWYSFHNGIDLVAKGGGSVKAATDGKVSYSADQWGGKGALIYHNDNLMTIYWHLQ